MRSIDKNKNIKTTKKQHFLLFNCDLSVKGGENGWISLPFIKMKFNLLNKSVWEDLFTNFKNNICRKT